MLAALPLLNEGVLATHELLAKTVDAISVTLRQSQETTLVASQIFMKVFDDFRCITLLGFSGYPIQTAGLTASVYESGLTLCYIGGDPTLANQWRMFSNPNSSFRPIKELIRGGLANIFDQVTPEMIEKEYSIYRQLCMAKHGNPMFQKTQGFIKRGGEVTLTLGPKSIESARHVIRFSVATAIMYTTWACNAVGKFHIEESHGESILFLRDRVLNVLERISSEIKKEDAGSQ